MGSHRCQLCPAPRHPSCWVLNAEASPQRFWGNWAEEAGPTSTDGGRHEQPEQPSASGAALLASDATTSAGGGAAGDPQPRQRKLHPSGGSSFDDATAPKPGGDADDVLMGQQQQVDGAADPEDPAGCSTSVAGEEAEAAKTDPRGSSSLAGSAGPSVEQGQGQEQGRPRHRQWWQPAGPSHAGLRGVPPSSWSDDLPRYDDAPRCGGCSFFVVFPCSGGSWLLLGCALLKWRDLAPCTSHTGSRYLDLYYLLLSP